MEEYKTLYYYLFNKITDIVDEMNEEGVKDNNRVLEKYIIKLRQLQMDSEEMFIQEK